jgi:hypothetical protein
MLSVGAKKIEQWALDKLTVKIQNALMWFSIRSSSDLGTDNDVFTGSIKWHPVNSHINTQFMD